MKRRDLLKSIIVVSAGTVIFPACEMFREPLPVYSNLTLNREEFNLIGLLSDAILPKGELVVENPETTSEFILTMVNDCYEKEDCEKYVAGLKNFMQLTQGKYNNTFPKLEKAQQLEFLTAVPEMKEEPKTEPNVANQENTTEPMEKPLFTKLEATQFFYGTTRWLTIKHFTGSEYFLTNHLDWKFVPGNYNGKVEI